MESGDVVAWHATKRSKGTGDEDLTVRLKDD
jgi:hypothetical protein